MEIREAAAGDTARVPPPATPHPPPREEEVMAGHQRTSSIPSNYSGESSGDPSAEPLLAFFCDSQSVVLVRQTKDMLYQANTIHTYTGGRDVLFYSVVFWKTITVSFCFSQSVLLVRLEPKICYTKITQSTPIQEDRMSVLFCSIMEKEGEGCFLTMAV